MAMKPLRPCRYPGCPELTREGYCPKHKPKRAGRRVSAQWHGWYSLPVWTDDLRPNQLLREPWCRECARRGIHTRATVVDHIQPHRGNWIRFIDRDNLQSLCKSCHDRKTALEMAAEKRQNRAFLVLGTGETGGMLGRAQRTCPRTASRRLARPYPRPGKV